MRRVRVMAVCKKDPKKSDHLQGQVDKQYDVVTETVSEESIPLRL
jgi:hypothetical protein